MRLLQFKKQLAAARLDHLCRTRIVRDDQPFAGRAELQRVDPPMERVVRLDWFAVRQTPKRETEFAVTPAGSERLTIRSNGDRADDPLSRLDRTHKFAVYNVPDHYAAKVFARREHGSVLPKGKNVDRGRRPHSGLDGDC